MFYRCLLPFLLLPLFASAQLVPLELNQTIVLPDTSGIWDVMPHPDGYYLWVQAVAVDTDTVCIYWGHTSETQVDSLYLPAETPLTVTTYWGNGHEPCIVFGTRWTVSVGLGTGDSLNYQAFSLATGQARSRAWGWRGRRWINYPYYDGYDLNYRAIFVQPHPLGPAISEGCVLIVSHASHTSGGHMGYSSTSDSSPGSLVANIFQDSSHVVDLGPRATAAVLAGLDDSVHILWSGSESGFSSYPGGSSNWFNSSMREAGLAGDSARLLSSLWECTHNDPEPCGAFLRGATISRTTGRVLALSRFGASGFGASGNDQLNTFLWTVDDTLSFTFAAEVVSGNNAEEFLAYDISRHAFQIFDASTGYWYGVTDTLSGGSEPRLVGRYDTTLCRFATREGNVLKLYRFGEYLAAEEQPAPVPQELSLAAYPNPFNPSTQLSFTLPQAGQVSLVVYDLNGRVVMTLADEVMTAGEHAVTVDGSHLPSGLYFVCLKAGTRQAVRKVVLLK